MIYKDSRILDILSEIKAISDDSLTLVRNFQEKWNLDDYDAVIESNVVSPEDLKNIVAKELRLQSIDSIGTICTSEECLKLINFQMALKWYVLPIGTTDTGRKKTLKLVISDPTSNELKEEIKKETGCLLDLVVGTRSEIHQAIFTDYPVEQQMPFVCEVMRGADL